MSLWVDMIRMPRVMAANPRSIPTWTLSFAKASGMIATIYVAIFYLTVPETIADAVVYAGNIQQYMLAPGGSSRPLMWDAGHLLWRPLGYALWMLFHSVLSAWSGGYTFLELVAVLISVNFLCGLVLAIIALAIARHLGLSMAPAIAATVGLLSTSAVLNYIHAGTSYVPGLTAQFVGLWFLLKAPDSQRATLYAGLGGAAIAISSLLWLPYLLTAPAALLAGWVSERSPQRGRLLAIATLTTLAVGLGFLTIGATARGATTLPAFKSWILDSSHGVQPDRRLVRLPNGVTRSFLFLGDDALLIKRFIFGDPYAPVHAADLLHTGLWKVVTVFLSGTALLWALLRSRSTRSMGYLLLIASVPIIGLALILFEPGQSERYLPLYAVLFCSVCVVLKFRTDMFTRMFFGAFLIAMLAVNFRAYGWDLRIAAHEDTARAELVREYVRPPGIALILSFRDPLSAHFQRAPFAPDNRKGQLPLFHVIESGKLDLDRWRSDSACGILDAWSRSGDVWLSLRLLAPRPEVAWQWTENDDLRVHWVDLPAFFSRLETSSRIGDADGFTLVPKSEHNQAYLETACQRNR
jgi:hypothetical protein